MNNVITTYDEFLNEELLDETRAKILKWWNNFQNRDNVIRKIHMYLNAGSWAALFIFIATLIAMWTPTDVGRTIQSLIKEHKLIYWAIFAMLSSVNTGDKQLMKKRKELVEKKMKELREMFAEKNYTSHYYVVLGDKKDIKAVLDKLKADDLITDANVIDVADVTLVDFSKTYNIKEPDKAADPYGEEDWADQEVDEREALQISNAAKNLEDKYKVNFRKVEDVVDYMDSKWEDYSIAKKFTKFGKTTSKMWDREYLRSVDRVKQRREERNRIPEPEGFDDDDDDMDGIDPMDDYYLNIMPNDLEYNKVPLTDAEANNYNVGDVIPIGGEDYTITRIDTEEDEAYAYPNRLLPNNWLEEERAKGNVKDLPDGNRNGQNYPRVAVKIEPPKKRFMDRFKDFVVPGFDVKPPEVMER